MNKVEQTRIKKGMTRRKLSDLTALSEDSIYKIERKNQIVKIPTALVLSKALGCTVEELFDNE